MHGDAYAGIAVGIAVTTLLLLAFGWAAGTVVVVVVAKDRVVDDVKEAVEVTVLCVLSVFATSTCDTILTRSRE